MKIAVFAGSLREGSYNKQLAQLAAAAVQVAGGDATYLDLRDYPMPLYDGDLEKSSGLTEHAKRLKTLFHAHDGLLIAAPEYNSSMSGVLKNTIDWLSRPGEGPLKESCFQKKVAAMVSASPGRLGGLRGLFHLRTVLVELGVLVLPQQVAIPQAHEAFAADGALKNPEQAKAMQDVAAALVTTAKKLHA